MLSKINVLSIDIDNLSLKEFIDRIDDFIASGKPHQIVTVNAEALVTAQKDARFRDILRTVSSLNTADGIGVLWAAKFLSLPVTDLPILKWLQACFQILYSGLAIIFWPRYIRSVISEKLSGSDLIWALAYHAQEKSQSLFLLGGYGDTSKLVASKLQLIFPKLRIVGTYAGHPEEHGIIDLINNAKPDILLVAFGPGRQEKWMAQNLKNLRVKVAIGLGGTFDYIAGKKPSPPQFLRNIGLEWLFRLVTQPSRFFRILKAVPVFAWCVLRYKLMLLRPYRKNVVACIVNEEGEMLICRRIPNPDIYFSGEHWQLPQGGIDHDESEEQALSRELSEELGIKRYNFLGKIVNAHHYDWPLLLADSLYEGRYRGQTQTLFFIKIYSRKQKVRLDQQEFNAYKWVKKEELLNSVHPIRRKLARIILENFERFVK